MVLQLRFASFLSLTSFFLFLCGGCTTQLERGGPVFVHGIPPGLRTCPPPGVRAEGRRRSRPAGPGLNFKEAHFCFICFGMPQGHRNRALARRRRVLMSHGRSVFPRHLGQGLSPVFRTFRCFVAL